LSNASKDERKTTLKTIRISESLARSLEKEADDGGVTVNADINSILSRHFTWHKRIREFGIAEIPKPLLKGLLEGCDDDTLARIGREIGPALWKEIAEFWIQDSSPDRMLDLEASWSKFNPNFQTSVTREEGAYTITMRHDLGPKWSIITKNALQEFARKSFHVEPRISAGESVVTARFKVNPRSLPSARPRSASEEENED
jgi:hypothetical protein